MCGVSAIVKSHREPLPKDRLTAMNDAVAHRGPDGEGEAFWTGKSGVWGPSQGEQQPWQVALGHRRLSILDLSDAGHQPMDYLGKYQLVFNGEIYNYVELREELRALGYTFQSSGDSEVVLAAYAAWGLQTFEKLRGMWAILLFDSVAGELVVSRDRMGIKPLYYFQWSEGIAFASEIKQLATLPAWKATINREACANYIASGFEKTDTTLFEAATPVEPGWVKVVNVVTRQWKSSAPYWSPEAIAPSVRDAKQAGQCFGEVFEESMQLHLRSDVPVGAQLSGGMDSSSIMMLMEKHRGADQSIHSFTTQFPGYEHDETEYVQAVLDHVVAEPHFDSPHPEQFLQEFSNFLHHHDEPVGSLTHFANFSLSRLIHQQQIKVVLNGQGGDELLGGYWQTYMAFLSRMVKDKKVLLAAKNILGALIPGGNSLLWPQAVNMLKRYQSRTQGLAAQLPWKANLSDAENLGQVEGYLKLTEQERRVYDIRKMLLPRLLKWDDRNLMAFSVEGRYPLLDHKLIETTLSFDTSTLYSKGWSKMPLRRAMTSKLPTKVINRKAKIGYVTPQEKWLFHDLKPTLQKWLKDERPVWEIMEPNKIQKMADEFWTTPANARAKGGIQNEVGQLLFRLFAFDRWMEVKNVSLS